MEEKIFLSIRNVLENSKKYEIMKLNKMTFDVVSARNVNPIHGCLQRDIVSLSREILSHLIILSERMHCDLDTFITLKI